MKGIGRKYCIECRWLVGPEDGFDGRELDRLAIEHYTDTGHTIVAESARDSVPERI